MWVRLLLAGGVGDFAEKSVYVFHGCRWCLRDYVEIWAAWISIHSWDKRCCGMMGLFFTKIAEVKVDVKLERTINASLSGFEHFRNA